MSRRAILSIREQLSGLASARGGEFEELSGDQGNRRPTRKKLNVQNRGEVE